MGQIEMKASNYTRHDYAPPMRSREIEFTRAHRIADVLGTAIGLAIVVGAILTALRWLS